MITAHSSHIDRFFGTLVQGVHIHQGVGGEPVGVEGDLVVLDVVGVVQELRLAVVDTDDVIITVVAGFGITHMLGNGDGDLYGSVGLVDLLRLVVVQLLVQVDVQMDVVTVLDLALFFGSVDDQFLEGLIQSYHILFRQIPVFHLLGGQGDGDQRAIGGVFLSQNRILQSAICRSQRCAAVILLRIGGVLDQLAVGGQLRDGLGLGIAAPNTGSGALAFSRGSGHRGGDPVTVLVVANRAGSCAAALTGGGLLAGSAGPVVVVDGLGGAAESTGPAGTGLIPVVVAVVGDENIHPVAGILCVIHIVGVVDIIGDLAKGGDAGGGIVGGIIDDVDVCQILAIHKVSHIHQILAALLGGRDSGTDPLLICHQVHQIVAAGDVDGGQTGVDGVDPIQTGAAAEIQMTQTVLGAIQHHQIAKACNLQLSQTGVEADQLPEVCVAAQIQAADIILIAVQNFQIGQHGNIQFGQIVVIDRQLTNGGVLAQVDGCQVMTGTPQDFQIGHRADVEGQAGVAVIQTGQLA